MTPDCCWAWSLIRCFGALAPEANFGILSIALGMIASISEDDRGLNTVKSVHDEHDKEKYQLGTHQTLSSVYGTKIAAQ